MSVFRRLGHQFSDPSLLELALSHRSVSGRHNNERLEFLGDSILGYVIAEWLYEHYPDEREGQLTRRRASLVNGKTLAVIARQLELGDCLKLGSGELKSGGYRRDSILADALEAVIGAIYLDGGLDAARAFILDKWQQVFAQQQEVQSLKDAKTRLQEWLQKRKLPLPVYELVRTEGDDHRQVFHVQVTLTELELPVPGSGKSRRLAEQQAAERALQQLTKDETITDG